MAPVLAGDNISAENCSLNESVDNTSSGRMSGEFLSTFDYWATPTDMSRYNPDIEITKPKKPDEETVKANPGMILMDNETAEKFGIIEGEITDYGNGTVTITFHQDSGPAGCSSSGMPYDESTGSDTETQTSPSFTFLSTITGIISTYCITALLRKKKNDC